MRKSYFILFTLLFIGLTNINAQTPPCNLTGGSVYIDNSANPSMMNASVNGMSMYDYVWTDTNGVVISMANQTPFYTQWCVTITDNITGCDTTICQDCIASTGVCMCILIYMPVCGCDGVMYSNYCIADCADVPWVPAVSNGMPGGFLPCSTWTPQNGSPSCNVTIIGDSVPCTLPVVLEAFSSSTVPITTYVWTDASGTTLSSGNLLTVSIPGPYYVSVTDSTGCVDSAYINISTMPMDIYSIPNPPIICLGESIYLVHDTSYTNTNWNTGQFYNPITVFPTGDFTYVAEAIDANGCNRRGEIFVEVDSCNTSVSDFLLSLEIYPNPTEGSLFIDNKENYLYDISLIDITGKNVLKQSDLRGSSRIDVSSFNSGVYMLRVECISGFVFKKVLIE